MRSFHEVYGGNWVGFGLTGGPAGVETPDNAVNHAWRTNALHIISSLFWDANTTIPEAAAEMADFSEKWSEPMRQATPGAGSYANEADANEADFKETFFGLETYARLLEIKQKYDPTDLFYANKAVGSDGWYVTGQLEGLPTSNGKLCRVST